MIRIGVVGYSGRKFNEVVANALLAAAFDIVEEEHPDDEYVVVSGLTDIGIPHLAYELADKLGWKTAGIACKKAEEYDVYPVDEKKIVGEEWGDESATFISDIDVMVRVGGGDQSVAEVSDARKADVTVYEFDLPEIKEAKEAKEAVTA